MLQLFSKGEYVGAFLTFNDAFNGLEEGEYEDARIAEIEDQKLIFIADLGSETEVHVRYSHATRITTFCWNFTSGNRVIVDTKVERFGVVNGVGQWLELADNGIDEYQSVEICGILEEDKWNVEQLINVKGVIFYIASENRLPDVHIDQRIVIVGECSFVGGGMFIVPIIYKVKGGKWQVNEH